jgi:hypothetical protein
MPGPNDPDRRLTNVLFLLGTAIVAFVPLYITRFHGAIENGALLLIGSVFAADAIMRCLNPNAKRTNWRVLFGVGSIAFLMITISEYSPIAQSLWRQDVALEAWLDGNESRLLRLRTDTQERKTQPDNSEPSIPNDSLALLFASLAIDAAVIFVIEEK